MNDFRIKEEVQLLNDSRFLPHLFKILSKQQGVKQRTTRCVVESVVNLLIALSSGLRVTRCGDVLSRVWELVKSHLDLHRVTHSQCCLRWARINVVCLGARVNPTTLTSLLQCAYFYKLSDLCMYKLVDYPMISRVRLAAIPTLPDISLRFVKFANIHLLIRYCRPRSPSLIVLGKLEANSISPLTPIQSLDQRVPVLYTTTYHYPSYLFSFRLLLLQFQAIISTRQSTIDVIKCG